MSHKSKDTRKIALDYYFSKKVSQREVAEIFQISEKTFRNWLKGYREEKSYKN